MAFEGLNAGEQITSDSLLRLAQSVANLLIAGPGVEIKRVGESKIMISATGGRGGTGTADFTWQDYTGP